MDVTPPGEGPPPLGRGWPKPAFVDSAAPVAVDGQPVAVPRVAAVGHRDGDGRPVFRDPNGMGLLLFTPGTSLEVTTPRGPAHVAVVTGYRLMLLRAHGDMPVGSFVVIDERGDIIPAAAYVDPVSGLPRADPPQTDSSQPVYGKGIMDDFLTAYTSDRVGRTMALFGHVSPRAPAPAAAPPAGRPGRAIELE